VRVIPTTIDTETYAAGAAAPRQTTDRPVVVGWTGSSTTIQHLEPLGPLLRALQESHGVRVRVIADVELAVPGLRIENRRWSPATEAADLAEIDVGVMPLPADDWASGKCGTKALQFMAMGIPTVMSPEDGTLGEARDGAALLALRSGAPVLPVAVRDSDLLWPKRALLPRPGRRVTVRYGRAFRVAEELPLPPGAMDRRAAKDAATRLIMSRIADLLPERQQGVYGPNAEAVPAGPSNDPVLAGDAGS